MKMVLDIVMDIKCTSCPSAELQCVVLSEQQLRRNDPVLYGWNVEEAWLKQSVPHRVSFLSAIIGVY